MGHAAPRIILSLGLIGACAFDSSASGGGVASLGDDDDETATTEPGGDTTVSTSGTASGSSASGSSASASVTSHASDVTSGDPSGDPSSADASDTRGTDPTTGGSTTELDPTKGDTSTSTGPGVVGWGACPDGDKDCEGDEICIEVFNAEGTAIYGTWCARTECAGPGDCPDLSDGSANILCVDPASLPPICVLDCEDAPTSCPTGMECAALSGGLWRCLWAN